VPLEVLVQALPSQCRMVPGPPIAQTSLAPLAQTPKRGFPWGNGFRQHQLSSLQTRLSPFTFAATLAGLNARASKPTQAASAKRLFHPSIKVPYSLPSWPERFSQRHIKTENRAASVLHQVGATGVPELDLWTRDRFGSEKSQSAAWFRVLTAMRFARMLQARQ